MPNPDSTQLLQKLLQILPQLLGGTLQGSPQQNPFGAHTNVANTGQLQTPLLASLLGGVLPGLQPQAGPTMTQADLLDMQARKRQQSLTEQKYVFAPSLRRLLSGMGPRSG